MDITKQVVILKLQIVEDDCEWRKILRRLMLQLNKETGCGVSTWILNQEFEDRVELILRDIAKQKQQKQNNKMNRK